MVPASIIVVAALLALLTPMVFVAMRTSVKAHRQQIITDLATIFSPSTTSDSALIPSFEFVKYKYFLPSQNTSGVRRPPPRDHHWIEWLFSAIPLTAALFFMTTMAFSLIAHVAFGVSFSHWKIGWLIGSPPAPSFVLVVVIAYLAAYLFMVRSFLTAINNFDLSPLSFLGAFINLIAGVMLGVIVVYGLINRTGSSFVDPSNSILLATTIATAFVVGYLPNVALRKVLRSTSLREFKRDDPAVYNSFKAIPVEVIDGIDTEIRDRLSDYHIRAVQNLATANPLMLFVETPYGIYQMLDWVGQAQLCCSVGPNALLKLWSLGIRTIFDLERVALDGACYDEQLLRMVGAVLFAAATEGKQPGFTPTVTMIKADIRLRLNDSHVHRLRQLFNRIDAKLGREAKRLPPILDCDPGSGRSCPFSSKDPCTSTSGRAASSSDPPSLP